jgi:hypothetical protein
MDNKKDKNISICTKDPLKAIFLAMFMLIAIPLTTALLVTEPIIAAVIDFGILIYIFINLICALIIIYK